MEYMEKKKFGTDKDASLQSAISRLKEVEETNKRYFEINEHTSEPSEQSQNLNSNSDNRRNRLSSQDRSSFTRNLHYDNTLAQHCHRIKRAQTRSLRVLMDDEGRLRSQYSDFIQSRRKLEKQIIENIQLGTANVIATTIPSLTPKANIYYLDRSNQLPSRSMTKADRVSYNLTQARLALGSVDKKISNDQRLVKTARSRLETRPSMIQQAKCHTDNIQNESERVISENSVLRNIKYKLHKENVDLERRVIKFYDKIGMDRTPLKQVFREENIFVTKLPKYSTETNDAFTSHKQPYTKHNRKPVSMNNLSCIRIIAPTDIDQLKQGWSQVPTCTADRSSRRSAKLNQTQQVLDKISVMTSTREIVLLREMLQSNKKKQILKTKDKI